MSWKERHEEWYNSELRQLNESNIYREKHRVFDKSLVSSGVLLIRQKKFIKYDILIIYPEATPYKSPSVYILNRELAYEEIKSISSNHSNLYPILKEARKLIYFRHQMGNGQVCYVENDYQNLDTPQIYTINDILNSIKNWLIEIKEGKIKRDSNQVELYSHFPNKDDEITVLLSKIFFDLTTSSGEFYLFKLHKSFLTKTITFIGIAVIEKTDAGVSKVPRYDEKFSETAKVQFPQPFEIITNAEQLKNSKNNGEIIEGSWWIIDKEPSPTEKLEVLIKLISRDEEQAFKKFFKSKVYDDLYRCEKISYLGLCFKNRDDLHEWAIFKLNRVRDTIGQLVLKEFNVEEMKNVINNYEISILKVNEFTEESFHKRNYKRADREILKSKSISIIGLGALGSEIADIVGKAGLGKIHLIDYQLLESNNPIRHLCGFNFLNEPKVMAVYSSLLDHNPFIYSGIKPHVDLDILSNNVNDYVDENGVGISTIADDNIESYLNEQAIINNKIIFYSRILRGGKIARIFRVIPGKDACFRCLVEYRQNKNVSFVDIPEDKDYPTLFTECNNPVRPASAADSKLISSLTSRIIIDYLQNGETKENHWIYYSEQIGNFQYSSQNPYNVSASYLPPHPNCPYCCSDIVIKIRILESELLFMQQEVTESKELETGGVLIGFKAPSNIIYICKVTGPGPNAVRKGNLFDRDVNYCQNILNEEYSKFGENGLYVGEWHYHPSNSNEPSNRDLKSLTEISEAPNYKTNHPIMLILDKKLRLSCTVHPLRKKYYFSEYEIIKKGRDEI